MKYSINSKYLNIMESEILFTSRSLYITRTLLWDFKILFLSSQVDLVFKFVLLSQLVSACLRVNMELHWNTRLQLQHNQTQDFKCIIFKHTYHLILHCPFLILSNLINACLSNSPCEILNFTIVLIACIQSGQLSW